MQHDASVCVLIRKRNKQQTNCNEAKRLPINDTMIDNQKMLISMKENYANLNAIDVGSLH